MDQAVTIDWSPILWVGGVFMAVITGLLGFIAINIREDKRMSMENYQYHEKWLKKHDKKFVKQHNEIVELAHNTHETISLIKAKLNL